MSSPTDAIWLALGTHIQRLLSGSERGRFGGTRGMCFALSGEPVADLNYAALWGAASGAEVEQLVAQLGGLDTMVVVSGSSKDRLAPMLLDTGFVPGGACPLMTTAPTPSRPDGNRYRVTAVRDEAEVAMMGAVLADAYSVAPEHMSAAFGPAILEEADVTPFLAWRNEEARSAVIATRVGASVGIWAMGTPTRFQRQGAGRSLLASVMSRSADEGARRCFLFPSPAGRRLYDSLGFIEADPSEIWLRGSSTEFPETTSPGA